MNKEAFDELFKAVKDCLDRDHPENQNALRGNTMGTSPITNRIPVSLWNKVKDAMKNLEPRPKGKMKKRTTSPFMPRD